MYPYSNLPKPLVPAEFYLLLALSTEEGYMYAIKARIRNLSLGSVSMGDSNLIRLMRKLEDEAFIDPVGPKPAGKSGAPRMHYSITNHGILRLKEELTRLDHAVKVGRNSGLMDDPTPIDIQRLLLDAHLKST